MVYFLLVVLSSIIVGEYFVFSLKLNTKDNLVPKSAETSRKFFIPDPVGLFGKPPHVTAASYVYSRLAIAELVVAMFGDLFMWIVFPTTRPRGPVQQQEEQEEENRKRTRKKFTIFPKYPTKPARSYYNTKTNRIDRYGSRDSPWGYNRNKYTASKKYSTAYYQNKYHDSASHPINKRSFSHNGIDWETFTILDWIAVAEETWKKFDPGNLDCQKRLICEVHQNTKQFGFLARKIVDAFSYLEYAELLRLPEELKAIINEYIDAADRGRTMKKECSDIYTNCNFSVKKMLDRVNHSNEI